MTEVSIVDLNTNKTTKATTYFNIYTLLHIRKEEILREIYSIDLARQPESPMSEGLYVDHRRRCEYHQAFKHNIDECATLQDFITSLTRRGHLDSAFG